MVLKRRNFIGSRYEVVSDLVPVLRGAKPVLEFLVSFFEKFVIKFGDFKFGFCFRVWEEVHFNLGNIVTVSYTHLDVYKRQHLHYSKTKTNLLLLINNEKMPSNVDYNISVKLQALWS